MTRLDLGEQKRRGKRKGRRKGEKGKNVSRICSLFGGGHRWLFSATGTSSSSAEAINGVDLLTGGSRGLSLLLTSGPGCV